MSAIAAKTQPQKIAAKSRADVRRGTRWLAAVILPIGPGVIALLRYRLPYFNAETSTDIGSAVLANPGAQSFVVWCVFIAIFTLVPAALWVGRLTRRHTPRLTATALLLLVPGYLALGGLATGDVILWAGAREGLDAATLGRLYETMHPAVMVTTSVFVLGHVLGTVLLGIALWRSRAVTRVAALLVIVSQPLHFVALIILASPTLDMAAWGMNAIGFAAASIAVLRLSNDEWDLPPADA